MKKKKGTVQMPEVRSSGHSPLRAHLGTATVAQTSKSAVSRVSKPAKRVISNAMPTWKSATQQVWKPALRTGAAGRMVTMPRCAPPLATRHSSLPFVLVNMAMTADGKIATANRAISSFGSRRDREHLLELRATADAVMAGARTVDSAKINLGPGPAKYRRLRINRGLDEYNLRVIISGSGSLNPEAEVFQRRFSPIIILTTRRAGERGLKKLRALADDLIVCGEREIDFQTALKWLREKWEIKRLLCEGGGELNGALFRAGLVDELHLTICPKMFGGREAPTIVEGSGIPKLADATQLKLKSMRRIGSELFLVYDVQRRPS
jgi:riboflavin-specific deaminase-like protein